MRARVIPGFVRRSAGGPVLVILDAEAAAAGPPQLEVTSDGASVGAIGTLVLDPALSSLQAALAARGAVPYKLVLDPIPGANVDVRVSVGGTSVGRRCFAAVPDAVPPEGLRIAVATCYYDYGGGAASYVGGLRVTPFGPPHFKILAGDNVYLDVVPGQIYRKDADAETADVYARYFLESEYGTALEASPNVVTWDDHELWNNYPEEQWWLARSSEPLRPSFEDAAQNAITLFQRPLNPEGVNPFERSFSFTIDPISFFIADTRTQRDRYTPDARPRLMPKNELFALTSWARTLSGPGVLVMGQPLWVAAGDSNDYTPPNFAEDYGEIWTALEDAPYDVLVFTGDVHHSRVLSIWTRRGWVHEVTTSPAVHIPSDVGVGAGSIFGASFGQGRGKVDYPGRVPIDPKFGVSPVAAQLLFAHDEPNTFATVVLRAVGRERVDVGIAMTDHKTGVIPTSKSTKYHSAKLVSCFTDGAFSLLAR
jgi:hypothetical protein